MRSATTLSEAESQCRYETLRSQALASDNLAGPRSAGLKFLQSQGLAAWLAQPDGQAESASSAEVVPTEADVIRALADLVLGDRQERGHGRANSTVT